MADKYMFTYHMNNKTKNRVIKRKQQTNKAIEKKTIFCIHIHTPLTQYLTNSQRLYIETVGQQLIDKHTGQELNR